METIPRTQSAAGSATPVVYNVQWSNGGCLKKVRQRNVGLEKNFLNKKNVGKERIVGSETQGGRKSVFVPWGVVSHQILR